MKNNPYRVIFLSIGLLACLATGCKTAELESIQQIKVQQLAKTCASWDGALLPAYLKGQPEITVLRIVIPAGETLAKHKHPVINAGVLLKGELTVHTEQGKTLHLKAGDSIVEVVDTWHYGKNEGTEPAEIIVFYAGAEGVPITIYKPD